jgi:hypothetical protein
MHLLRSPQICRWSTRNKRRPPFATGKQFQQPQSTGHRACEGLWCSVTSQRPSHISARFEVRRCADDVWSCQQNSACPQATSLLVGGHSRGPVACRKFLLSERATDLTLFLSPLQRWIRGTLLHLLGHTRHSLCSVSFFIFCPFLSWTTQSAFLHLSGPSKLVISGRVAKTQRLAFPYCPQSAHTQVLPSNRPAAGMRHR